MTEAGAGVGVTCSKGGILESQMPRPPQANAPLSRIHFACAARKNNFVWPATAASSAEGASRAEIVLNHLLRHLFYKLKFKITSRKRALIIGGVAKWAGDGVILDVK